MKTILLITILAFAAVSKAFPQYSGKISKPGLEEILENPGDKLLVINFWASWCGPCVTELPGFQKVVNNSDTSRVDFLFVSLDFASEEKNLVQFLEKNNYSFKVVLMTDTDYNSWIDMVDPQWQGNIPVTLFVNKTKDLHFFVPRALDHDSLENIINSYL